MKIKLLSIAIASLFIYSCAPKQVVQTSKKEEPIKVTTIKTAQIEEKKEGVVLNDNQLHGKSVYENNCAKCHKLYDVKSHSAEEWKPIVARMQKKAKISDEDAASVYNYLTASL